MPDDGYVRIADLMDAAQSLDVWATAWHDEPYDDDPDGPSRPMPTTYARQAREIVAEAVAAALTRKEER